MAVAVSTQWLALIGLVFLVPAARALRVVLGGATGRDLVPVLQQTGVAEILWALGVAVGLA